MLLIKKIVVAVFLACIPVFAVDGIAVGAHSNSTHGFGWHKGSVRAHLIVGSQVQEVKDIYAGTDARCISVSPSATRIAFIRGDSKLCTKNMEEGGDVQVIADIPWDAWIDWPTEEHIYFTNQWQGDQLKRVPSNGGTVETFASGLQSAMQFSITPDLSRGTAVTCCYSARSWQRNGGSIPLVTDMGGCGAGISPSGTYFSNNQGDHASVKIWNFDGSLKGEWNTGRCPSAGSNWNRLRWSANSNDWVCFTQGQPYQLEDFHNIVLYYVPDSGATNIQVTSNSNGAYDEADDFWVGDPYSVFGSKPRISLSASSITFNASESASSDPAPQEIAISNSGTAGTTLPALGASSDASWLSVQVINGNEKVVNTVSRSGLSTGVHNATVTISGTNVSSVTYTVTFVYKAAQVFTTVSVNPSSGSVAPGGNLAFVAVARDQDGDAMGEQPSFTWSMDGGGSINSSGIFTAYTSTGGPYTVSARATIGSITLSGTATLMVQSLLFRMNCGGEAVDDWMADNYSTGVSYTFGGEHNTDNVTDLAPNAVYQTCRHNGPVYSFPSTLVPDGDYQVRLHFTDGAGDAGGRSMNIIIEGEQVLTGLDIVGEAGGRSIVIVKEFDVTVDDGNGMTVEIALGSGNDGFISGIEVFAAGGEAPKMVVLSPSEGDAFRPGETITIEWRCDTVIVGGVLVKISSNNGMQWELISPVSGSIPSHEAGSTLGRYVWQIPDDFALSNSCKIRVEDYYDDGSRHDESGVFTIGDTEINDNEALAGGKNARVRIATLSQRDIIAEIPFLGWHSVQVYALDGTLVRYRAGTGPAEYIVPCGTLSSGMYIVKIVCSGVVHKRSVTLMGR